MKIKPGILVFITVLLLLATISVSSLTRRISSTNDNVYTLIRNSNGKYWEATSGNIQLAVDDLNNNSGTVWLPGNKTFYLTATLIIHRNVVLDMGGCAFKLPNGVNTNVVELKDGAGIKNGVIDVAGHHSNFTTNTSFDMPSACIYLNASSCIDSATIDCMFLNAISDGYNLMGPDPPRFYSSNYSGLGYGIYLHATNDSVPQKISNVSVKYVYLRSFKIGIYINNERNPASGEDGAFIQGNNFENLCFDSTSYGINITRVTSASKGVCGTSFNRFDQVQFQTGNGSWWGGEEISWSYLGRVDGTGNSFTNMMLWDYSGNHRGSGPAINFTSDSDHCYLHIYGCGDSWFSNNGSDNTILLVGDNNVNLYIGKVYEKV